MESLSSKISKLIELNELNLNDCLLLKTPPPEICRRGLMAIRLYLNRLATCSKKCSRTKLFVCLNIRNIIINYFNYAIRIECLLV